LKALRRKAEELLWATSMYGVARFAYHNITANGRLMKARLDSLRTFFGPLVSHGSLVFDIGANKGHYSSVFQSLGLRTIAVEPNPDCVRHIQISYEPDIETLQVAVGERNGLVTFNLSDEKDELSSLSENWIASLQRVRPDYVGLTARKVTVPVVTLDSLIEQFGVPYYIKIDVEGCEEGGLSVQPELLSFEFNTAFVGTALRCLEHGLFRGGNLFNLLMEYSSAFAFPQWMEKERLKQALKHMEQETGSGDHPGDIFVKRAGEAAR
jgi:FkbM family methyltransferase